MTFSCSHRSVSLLDNAGGSAALLVPPARAARRQAPFGPGSGPPVGPRGSCAGEEGPCVGPEPIRDLWKNFEEISPCPGRKDIMH